jgi:hypothetical protein
MMDLSGITGSPSNYWHLKQVLESFWRVQWSQYFQPKKAKMTQKRHSEFTRKNQRAG